MVYFPDTKDTIRFYISSLISDLAVGDFKFLKKYKFYKKLNCFKKREYVIRKTDTDDNPNPLYEKFQEYLILKFLKNVQEGEIIAKRGEVEIGLLDMQNETFTDEYQQVQNMTLDEYEEQTKSIKKTYDHTIYIRHSIIEQKKSFILTSKTASSDMIKAYVKKVTIIRYKNENTITVYRPLIQGKKKDERTIEWEKVLVKTNKTVKNTIYSQKVNKDLFDDLQQFIENENVYSKRGMPYNRGYFLEGPAGTGKTSVAKIIANMYGIPVFCLDLTTIDENSTLIRLMTEINYYTNQEGYILLMEDADRSEFFDKERYRYDEKKQSKLTMDCLLNCIDGVLEPHGRILIITSNFPEVIQQHKALIRPGRIDKIIKIDNCDVDQIKRMYELFFEEQLDWSNFNIEGKQLSPAYVMKLLQENFNNKEAFQFLIGYKTGDIPDEIKPFMYEKKDEEKGEEAHNRYMSRRHRRRGYIPPAGTTAKSLKSRVRALGSSIKAAERKMIMNKKKAEKHKLKMEQAAEKLKLRLEKEKINKLKEKAKRKVEYLKKKSLEEVDEEEYETPAFMMNDIEASEVDEDTIVTYEVNDDDEVTDLSILEKKEEQYVEEDYIEESE